MKGSGCLFLSQKLEKVHIFRFLKFLHIWARNKPILLAFFDTSIFSKAPDLCLLHHICACALLYVTWSKRTHFAYTVPMGESPEMGIQSLSSVFSILGAFTNSNCVSVSFICNTELPICNNPAGGL